MLSRLGLLESTPYTRSLFLLSFRHWWLSHRSSLVCRRNSNQGSHIYHSECPGRLRHVRYNGRCCVRFYPRAFYSPSLNIFLLFSSVVALFQPNAPLPRFPLKCRRLRAGCQMLQSLPLWCYQAHEGTSVSMLSKCRAFWTENACLLAQTAALCSNLCTVW